MNTVAAGIASLRDGSLPPFSVPLRFFITAPWFLIAAGLFWLVQGDTVFASRWTPGMLASTHLVTLGFFTMIMCGALFQVVPVLGGKPLHRPSLVAAVTHAGLAVGALLLSRGLWTFSKPWLLAALTSLAVAAAAFLPAAGLALWRSASALVPVRFAAGGLLCTGALGALLLLAIAFPELGIAFRNWTNLHAAVGGAGWGLLLVVAVGHQVVPMFHVTKAYPAGVARSTAPAIAAGLLLLLGGGLWAKSGTILIALTGLLHVGVTAVLLHHRKRRRADATVLGWQCGAVWLAAALILLLANELAPEDLRPGHWLRSSELFVAVLFAIGGIGTIVLGMLTKIVPFLAFLHLQRRALPALAAMRELPPMEAILGQPRAHALIVTHQLTSVAIAAATQSPTLTRIAGACLIADGLLAFALVLQATARYRRARTAVDRALALATPAEGRR